MLVLRWSSDVMMWQVDFVDVVEAFAKEGNTHLLHAVVASTKGVYCKALRAMVEAAAM